MLKNSRKIIGTLIISSLTILSGCIGIYDNSNQFLNNPKVGSSEVSMLKAYGTPSFSGEAENSRIYTYRIRESKYIILIGFYDGYDLIVECKDGQVVDTKRLKQTKTFTLLQPNVWGESFQ